MQEDALSTQVAICAITGWQRQSTTAVDWDGTWKGRHETVTAPVNICLRALNVRRHKVGRKCSTLVRISDWMMRRWFKMRHHGSDVMQVTSSDWVLLSFQLANTKRRLYQLHLVANSLPGNRVIGQHLSSSCRGWVWGLTSPDNAGWPVGSMLTISVKTSWRQQEGRYLGRYLVTNWQWCCHGWHALFFSANLDTLTEDQRKSGTWCQGCDRVVWRYFLLSEVSMRNVAVEAESHAKSQRRSAWFRRV